MPNRLIKESICTSEKINELSDFNFRLWVNLITYVDDFGRGDARPAIIKGRCFPLRERVTLKDILMGLNVLADTGCILLYTVGGESYLCFPNWDKHQTVRNKKSKYPGPNEADSKMNTIASNCKQLQANVPVIQSNPIQSESESESESNPNAVKARFERFWAAYPRKQDKQRAKKEFEALKPDEDLLKTMLTAIERWKTTDQWTEDGGKYIPHPGTWLHNKRWEDEPPKANAKPSGRGKTVIAQQYEQRSYAGMQETPEEMMARLVGANAS